jgi:outer membrane protein OmpA-like peptidoglycan-associated protein
VFCFCTIALLPNGLAQTSLSAAEKKGDAAFSKGDYTAAATYYKQAGIEHSTNKKARLHYAISLYEVNQVDAALSLLNGLYHEGKTAADVFYYLAKADEAKNLFTEAIGAYKHFLQSTKKEDPRRTWVKDQLVRCANGARLKYIDEAAYVENAGESLNTPFNEFGVKNSPTNMGKIYFSSDRTDQTSSRSVVKIYAAALDNGRWTEPTLLPQHINANAYQEVSGFSTNGQVLYYLIQKDNQFRIRTDTFSELTNGQHKGYFMGPLDVNSEGTDLVFFNDTICLFASNKPGGFGGYDLYISFKNKNTWSTGINLGPVINSFYDERHPFLTLNGRTLIYASNSLESMGGFDIFTTTFDVKDNAWSLPRNLGYPLNSAGNENSLVVSPDGTSAYLVSDRKTGFGEQDIYTVFFKQPLLAHQEISEVPTFQQLLLAQKDENAKADAEARNIQVKEYYISHLFLEENAEILIPQNIKKLDLLVNLMMIYPKIKAELSCFETPSGQQTFSLYFSIKKTEEAAGYLVKKGIAADRIILKGYGPSFPVAMLPEGTTNTALYKRLNHRMEITLHDYESEPVNIHMEKVPVPPNMIRCARREIYEHAPRTLLQCPISHDLSNPAEHQFGIYPRNVY